MKKHIFTVFIVLAITSVLIAACQPAAGEVPGEPEAPPSETQPTPESPAAEPAEPAAPVASTEVMLDPSMAVNPNAAAYVYEGLVMLQEGQPVLVLAIAVTVSDDGLDYIVELLPGVAFHDGTLLNADAVIANFNRWFDPQDALRGSGSYDAWAQNFGGFKGEADADGKPNSKFDGIEKVDERTVLIHLNTPDEELLTKLADPAFAIISPAALAAPHFGSPAGVDGGTGPYMVGGWSASGVTLEPYPDYWDSTSIPESGMDVPLQ